MFSIKNNDVYEYIIKGSKFISLIFRVYNKDEVNAILSNIKNEYPNATNYCYGYVISSDVKASDDNEPSGTAGYPILNQITILMSIISYQITTLNIHLFHIKSLFLRPLSQISLLF